LADKGSADVAEFVLSVHPSVVFKLGEDLITDDVQALTELIKNSYDADSPIVEVSIDTTIWTTLRSGEVISEADAIKLSAERRAIHDELRGLENRFEDSDYATDRTKLKQSIEAATEKLDGLHEPVQGLIRIADLGSGMTLNDIELGWLTVSASRKRAMKERGERTTRGRTPLGDKGLGRLGAQRLGRVLELDTRTAAESPLLHAMIVWEDFLAVESLARVPISIQSVQSQRTPGTTIVIRGLHEREQWKNARALQAGLVDVISPYRADLGFDISIEVDDVDVDLRERSQAALDTSSVTYSLDYRNGILTVHGAMSMDYLRPDNGQEKIALWEELIHSDRGARFLDYFLEHQGKKAVGLNIQRGDLRRFVEFHSQVKLDEESDFESTLDAGDEVVPADPGPFEGQVDVFQRRKTTAAFESKREYDDWISAATGVRLYRDGFGIRLRTDWLDLASQWTTASSWYTIRPANVVGYINLTAADNGALQETSNREDIRDTPSYRNFQRLLARWLTLTEIFQSAVRRAYNEFVKLNMEDRAGVSAEWSPAELVNEVAGQLQNAADVGVAAQMASSAAENARNAIASLRKNQSSLEEELFIAPEVLKANALAVQRASEAIELIDGELDRVRGLAADVENKRSVLVVLQERLENAEAQIRDVWELVSLGITSETISHEVANISRRIEVGSRDLAKYNDRSLHDRQVAEFAEDVRSSAASLSKQVSHMDASLRYVRDRRTSVSLASICKSTAEFFNSRFEGQRIVVEVIVVDDVSVLTSRGKLLQVLDNLLLNSEYWVAAEIKSGRITAGVITLTVDGRSIAIADNGPGIHPSVEGLIFDPFVSRKPRGEGRGLGLYVVRQLLDSEGASISLDLAKNAAGNRYRFRISFDSKDG